MGAKELLEANQLSAAVAELTQDVKRHPTDVRLRTFLFEALCFQGEFQRANAQLDVISHQDEKTGIGVEIYRSLLRAEALRRKVFDGVAQPNFISEPPSYASAHLAALSKYRAGEVDTAKRLLTESESRRTALSGRIDQETFSSFRESDDRLAPILEIIIKDSYVWLPFEQISKLVIVPPKQLRDLLWIPVTVEMANGQGGEAFVPVLYAGSEIDENEQIRLGRVTEWVNLGDGVAGGLGQRTFLVDGHEKALLEIRELEFTAV